METLNTLTEKKEVIRDSILEVLSELKPLEVKCKHLNDQLSSLRKDYEEIDRQLAMVDGRYQIVDTKKAASKVKKPNLPEEVKQLLKMSPEKLQQVLDMLEGE